jgi:predicted DCC family thiol-disulfide oxidoreductase YuxK
VSGWFTPVPAYRLATMRVVVAVVTLLYHLPQTDQMIVSLMGTSFHMPELSWLPALPWLAGGLLVPLRHLAGWSLLLGLAPRASAAFLGLTGMYLLLLDVRHYSHHVQFHVTLLLLLAVANDRVSLLRLLRDDDATARVPAWQEDLVRLQLAIVFFFTALDKVLSPFWGFAGTRISRLQADHQLRPHNFPLSLIEVAHAAAARHLPGLLSVGTIAVEGSLALAFLVRRLWPAAVVGGYLFAAYLEFAIKQSYFAWSLAAALVVVLPAGDRGWTVLFDADCALCQSTRRILSPLDWLRRLRWEPIGTADLGRLGVDAAAALREMHVVSPHGTVRRGFDAARALPFLLPGPLLAALAVLNAGEQPILGVVRPRDAVFLIVGALLLLWLPGVSRLAGQPLYARLAAARYRLSERLTGERCETGACTLHAPRR